MTPDLATLRDLHARVQEATGPSRELDARIWQAVVNGAAHFTEGFGTSVRIADEVGHPLAPPLTASIDAAVALVERVLPASFWEIDRNGCGFIRLGDYDIGEEWKAVSPAIGLCAALLSALIAKAERSAAIDQMVAIGQELDLP